MKTTLNCIALAFNVMIAGILVFRRDPHPGVAAASPEATSVENPPTRRNILPGNTDATTPERFAAAPAETNSFHWRLVESTNYPTYIINLRAIGCPEATIHDLIRADLHALYRAQRRDALATMRRNFWSHPGQSSTAASSIEQLCEEEQAVLAALLPELRPEAEEKQVEIERETALRLDCVAQNKRGPVMEAWRQCADACDRVLKPLGERPLTEVELVELTRLENVRNQTIAAMLSPEELSEYELRNSSLAENVRQSLLGVEVTESQFRQLFEYRRGFETALTTSADPNEVDRLTSRYNLQVRDLLGPEAFGRYQRAGHPRFREMADAARNANLPWEVIEKSWDQRQTEVDLGRSDVTIGNEPASETDEAR